MFHLSRQERLVAFSLAVILFFGSSLRYVFKKYPKIDQLINFLNEENLIKKLDVNRASAEELVAIPYIGEYTAGKIVAYRKEHGLFEHLEELKQVSGIRDKNFRIFSRYLVIKHSKERKKLEHEAR